MRTYYHFYVTCPSCHEPHSTGAPIQILKDRYKCSSCGAIFKRTVNLTSYIHTCQYLVEKNQNEVFLSGIPLLWKVSPNIVESSYIDWLKTAPEGKFIITWPWKEVKFIPLLFSEYLSEYPERSVIIIGNVKEQSDNIYGHPGMNEIFEKMIYLKKEDGYLNDNIKREMNKFNRKDVLFKDEITYYTILRRGLGDISRDRFEDVFDGTPEKCRRTIFKELYEDYGEECIRNYRKIPSKRKSKVINENGIFDITIGNRPEWTGELKFNKSGLWNVLINVEHIKNPSFEICTHNVIDNQSLEDISTDIPGLYLISDSLNPKMIFDKILKMNPEIVIIQDLDDFLQDQIYRGNKSKSLFNFLKKFKNTVLMFSTLPDIRHLLKINTGDSVLKKFDIDIHTWDSGPVGTELNKLMEPYVIKSPLSSTYSELPDYGSPPSISYHPLPQLDLIDEIIQEVKRFDRNYYFYLNEIKKTVLKIKGDYNNPDVFKRYLRDFTLQYDIFISKLVRNDEKLAVKVMNLFEKVYKIRENQENPLLDELINLTNQLLSIEKNNVSIIVHGLDVRGTEKLLKDKGFAEEIPLRLEVVTWKNLILRKIDERENHYVISLRPPSFDYQLYFSKNVKQFIFMGSVLDLEKTKKIIDNRLTESISRPLILSGCNKPVLLEKIFTNLNIDLESINESDSLIENEGDFYFDYHNSETIHNMGSIRHSVLKKGEDAILALNKDDMCMFIPVNRNIYFKREDEGTVEEIKIKKDNINEIQNKAIIVNRKGVYTSFKHIFTRFMYENSDAIHIKTGMYKWDTFSELYENSISWIEVLRMAIKRLMKEHKIDEVESENKLALYLASLGLNARNSEYIKKWWSEPELINGTMGIIPIYDIEHPKSRLDLIKIYDAINDQILLDMDLNQYDAEKSYLAARTLQKLRREFFKNQKKNIPSRYHHLYELLIVEIQKIVNQSDSFLINKALVVKIKKEVHTLEMIPESKAIQYIDSEV